MLLLFLCSGAKYKKKKKKTQTVRPLLVEQVTLMLKADTGDYCPMDTTELLNGPILL